MEARAPLRQGKISIGLLVALLALAATFLLGVAGGYLVKAVTSPATTQTQFITIPAASPKQTILPKRVIALEERLRHRDRNQLDERGPADE